MATPLSHSPEIRQLRNTLPLLKRVYRSWATRSLAIGALATGLDILVGLICLHLLSQSTRVGAMTGVAIGGAFTFIANRYFAFKEKNPQLAKPALKFILVTGIGMVIHGQLVVLMREQMGIPFVVAKVIADVGVFSVGQLLVLRYLVFPNAGATEEPLLPRATGELAVGPDAERRQVASARR